MENKKESEAPPKTSGNQHVLGVWDSFPLNDLKDLSGFRHFKWDAKMLVHAEVKTRIAALKQLSEIIDPQLRPFAFKLAEAMLKDSEEDVQQAAQAAMVLLK
jgi:HEAT repeat protein